MEHPAKHHKTEVSHGFTQVHLPSDGSNGHEFHALRVLSASAKGETANAKPSHTVRTRCPTDAIEHLVKQLKSLAKKLRQSRFAQ